MVHLVGLRIFIILAVVNEIFSQQSGMFNSQLEYQNLEHRYLQNVRLSSYGTQMQLPQTLPIRQPEPTETRIIKHPDEKIVHHPSPIYVKRPPTFVTINHPDIIIEPNPVVYHKPAAVVRSPVIYKQLPQKVQYRHVMKHIVKPVERKIVLKERRQPHSCTYSTPKYFVEPQVDTITDATKSVQHQQYAQRQYFVGPHEDALTDATNNIQYQQYVQRPIGMVSQAETMSRADAPEGELMDENEYVPPLNVARVYYRQSFPAFYSQ